jgi:hypothetical protein
MNIEVLKLALDALEIYGAQAPAVRETIAVLRQAIERAQKQEPVAWGMMNDDGVIYDCICPEEHDRHQGEYTTPLYTSPPQRPAAVGEDIRKPLTDEEIEQCFFASEQGQDGAAFRKAFARAIEADHGIKGEA